MSFLYIVVRVESEDELERVRAAAARPWLNWNRDRHVRYWVPSLAAAEREQALLALADISSRIEGLEPSS